MTVEMLLIRHAAHGDLGKILTGRTTGVPLTAAGREQAKALAAKLGDTDLAAIHSSPAWRALETAAILAAPTARQVRPGAALDEIDFGEWTGRDYAALDDDPEWREWNANRAAATARGGESMISVLARLRGFMTGALERYCGRTIALVTHCDIIRTLVIDILGLTANAVHRLEVAPASLTRIRYSRHGGTLISLNEQPA